MSRWNSWIMEVDMTLSFCDRTFAMPKKQHQTSSMIIPSNLTKLASNKNANTRRKSSNPTKKRLLSMTVVKGFFRSIMPSSNHHPPTSNFHLGGTSPSQEKASKMFHHPQFVTPRKINGWNPKTWRNGSDDVPFQLRVIFFRWTSLSFSIE